MSTRTNIYGLVLIRFHWLTNMVINIIQMCQKTLKIKSCARYHFLARGDEYYVRKFKKPKPYKAYDTVGFIIIIFLWWMFEGIYLFLSLFLLHKAIDKHMRVQLVWLIHIHIQIWKYI